MDERIKSVIFDEDQHKYSFQGKELHGVTGVIGKLLGKSFPDLAQVQVKTLYGSDVHKEVENYYNSDSGVLSSESSKWVVEDLTQFADGLIFDRETKTECEVMVSDFEGTASKVDVVMHTVNGAYLFDIKTTSHFDRRYCSLQLSVYKRLFEQCYGEKVLGLFVLGTNAKRHFHILEQDDKDVDKILNMNKE